MMEGYFVEPRFSNSGIPVTMKKVNTSRFLSLMLVQNAVSNNNVHYTHKFS